MTKEEKLDLKKILIPIAQTLFDSDQKKLFVTYPFLSMNDDDIEDDELVSIPSEEHKKYLTFVKSESCNDLFMKISKALSGNTSSDLIRQIQDNSISNSLDYKKGFFLNKRGSIGNKPVKWFFNFSGMGSLMMIPVPAGCEEEVQKYGYKDVVETIRQGLGIEKQESEKDELIQRLQLEIVSLRQESEEVSAILNGSVATHNPLANMEPIQITEEDLMGFPTREAPDHIREAIRSIESIQSHVDSYGFTSRQATPIIPPIHSERPSQENDTEDNRPF